MKKSIKNTIMIGMAAVLIGTSAVTISYAQQNKGAAPFAPPSFSQQSDRNQNENPFESFNQNGNNQNGGFGDRQLPENQQNGSSSDIPSPPDENQSGGNSQQSRAPGGSQDSSGSSQQQAPNSTEGSDSNSDNSNSNNSSSSAANTSLSVEALAEEDAVSQNTSQQRMPANGVKNRNGSVISALCYMFAALQIAIILSILAYLIISKMNRISFNEVLANMKKNNNQQ